MASVIPKNVLYCGEYCGFTASAGKCKKWLIDNHPDLVELFYPDSSVVPKPTTKESIDGAAEGLQNVSLTKDDDTLTEDSMDKKHQSRGGKALPKDEQKRLDKEEQKRKKAKVILKMVERNKRKSVTHIRGMEAFGLDLKKVAKRLASKYACGCSVARNPAGYDEIVIQGDFVMDLEEFIPQEWNEVSPDQIEIVTK